MAAGRVLTLHGVALMSIAIVGNVDNRSPPNSWTLDVMNADGEVVLVANAITVTTRDGTTAAVTSAYRGGPDGDVWRLRTERSELDVLVLAKPGDEGTTTVSITPVGMAAADVSGVSVSFATNADERFFGLGERADAVEHRGSTVVNRVSDGPWTGNQLGVIRQVVPAAGFSDRADATYFPVPWVLSTNGYGVLVDNDETSRFDLATDDDPDRWTVQGSGPDLRLRVFTATTSAETLGQMTAAVGRQPSPVAPWMFGPWWQAAGDESSELAALQEAGVPMSVVQTYTHYLPCGDHRDREAEEQERVDRLHAAGLAVTTYVNPMVCVSYRDAYMPGSLTDAFTLGQDGLPYRYRYFTTTFFDVVQFDFSSRAGVDLFHELLDEAVANGYDGWMEDFGEYTPDDAVSADGTSGPAMHNRYPELYHDAGWSYVRSAPRPLVRFNRSGWTGAIDSSQVVWGGDPTTSWGFDGLQSAVYSALGMGLSGVSLWGSDIGGFFTFDGEQPTHELLARWIEFGAFSPVMRLQAGGVSLVDEARPTVLDPDVLDIWRRYSQLRTRLYPYIAGSQDAYAVTGLPMMRHMVLGFPDDPMVNRLPDQYLFGSDLLVAPVVVPGAESRAVFLPGGTWIEWWPSIAMTDDGAVSLGAARPHHGGRSVIIDAPLGEIPLFVRSGAVIPLLREDVQTLADYGDDGVVRLADREDQRTLLAFPEGDWFGPLGPGEVLASTVTEQTWTLRFDATGARTYNIQASLAGLPDGFTPCAVTVHGVDSEFEFDEETRVLGTTVEIDATGELIVTAC